MQPQTQNSQGQQKSSSKENMENPFREHATELREKASALGHDVQELGKITKSIAGDTVHYLEKNATDYYDQGMQKAQKIGKNLQSSIRENPVRFLIIAAGIGLTAGFLWKRRK